MGGHAAVGALAAVGGVAHFTCNFSIWVGHAAGGSCCAFLGGGTCCAPLNSGESGSCYRGFKIAKTVK